MFIYLYELKKDISFLVASDISFISNIFLLLFSLPLLIASDIFDKSK